MAVATLSIVEREDVCDRAEATTEQIRAGLRQVLVEEDVPWGIYGDASAFLIFQNPNGLDIDPGYVDVAIERWSARTGLEPRLEGPAS